MPDIPAEVMMPVVIGLIGWALAIVLLLKYLLEAEKREQMIEDHYRAMVATLDRAEVRDSLRERVERESV